jgi:AraC-like DNA-binding protein
MQEQDLPLEQRVSLFSNMVLCCHNLYYTIFDEDGSILFQNAPEGVPIGLLFDCSVGRSVFPAPRELGVQPVFFSSSLGLSWIIVPMATERTAHVLGSFFQASFSLAAVESQLEQQHMPMEQRRKILGVLHDFPIISINRVFEYAVMLYYCLYGQRITHDALVCKSDLTEHPAAAPSQTTTIHGTYEMEQEMLRLVREGNLNYRAHMNKIAVTGTLGTLSNGDSLRQMKNAVLVCITLFSRAAIDGGLNPEVSLSLTDHYFQSVEACDNLEDLADITYALQEDFVQRVHASRTNTAYSPAIRSSIEYLDYHLEEEIDWRSLAASVGYDVAYFRKKFKKETGTSPRSYLMDKRFARGQQLLRTSSKSIQEISAQLRFCSQSYFTEQFRSRFGCTPAEYRAAAQEGTAVPSAKIIEQ